METIFVKKSVEEKPKEDSFYFLKARNKSDIVNCHYNKEKNEWHDSDYIFTQEEIQYWLQEVELMTDKEIDNYFPLQYGMEFFNFNKDVRKGVKWMRDNILGLVK